MWRPHTLHTLPPVSANAAVVAEMFKNDLPSAEVGMDHHLRWHRGPQIAQSLDDRDGGSVSPFARALANFVV
jgi:hypothetical protein